MIWKGEASIPVLETHIYICISEISEYGGILWPEIKFSFYCLYVSSSTSVGENSPEAGLFVREQTHPDSVRGRYTRYMQEVGVGMNLMSFKGTGTRDLIWLKVVSLERSWWVGLTEDL